LDYSTILFSKEIYKQSVFWVIVLFACLIAGLTIYVVTQGLYFPWYYILLVLSGVFGGYLGSTSTRIIESHMVDVLGSECVKNYDYRTCQWLLFSRSLPENLKTNRSVEDLLLIFDSDYEISSISLSNHPIVAFAVVTFGLFIGALFSRDFFWMNGWWAFVPLTLPLIIVFVLAMPNIFIGKRRQHLEFLSAIKRLPRLLDDALTT
jgi:hypothetical protein